MGGASWDKRAVLVWWKLTRPMGGYSSVPFVTDHFYHPYIPDSQDRKTRWALAFYREGLMLSHPAYQCLSFFKVLNIFRPKGDEQIDWINSKVADIRGEQAKLRISLLCSHGQDVGQYLYGSNRCAVAHAGGQPTVDPENPSDLRRLNEDLPLVQALAELAIEHEFGIKSSDTVYREHLYELQGFREIFGNETVSAIKVSS
jgi:hypothetical protein